MIVTNVGYGDDYYGALADADQQLRPGEWQRLSISQPTSIRADLDNAGKNRQVLNNKRPGEREFVTILPPVVRTPTGTELSDD